MGERTSQTSFQKIFQPITAKLDDVSNNAIVDDIKLPKRKLKKKGETPDRHTPDEILNIGLEGLFDEGVQPQHEKQLVPKVPKYEESLADMLNGNKQIYVDPQYCPEEPELPPEYEEDDQKKLTTLLMKKTRLLWY